MRDRRRVMRGLAAVPTLLIGLSGCGPHTGAPRGWLPVADDSLRDTYGGWINLSYEAEERRVLKGEFLAVDADSVYVLTADALLAVPLASVTRATVAGYDPRTGAVSAVAVLGSLTALSHGAFAVFTIPLLWIGGGTVTAYAHARDAIVHLHDQNWDPLCKFARFPQGPPPGIRSLGLRPRPYVKPPPRPGAATELY